MFLSARDRHLTEPLFKLLDNHCYHLWIFVGYLVVVYVPRDGALFAFDGGVGNARVVWVQLESHLLQGRIKHFVPQ